MFIEISSRKYDIKQAGADTDSKLVEVYTGQFLVELINNCNNHMVIA